MGEGRVPGWGAGGGMEVGVVGGLGEEGEAGASDVRVSAVLRLRKAMVGGIVACVEGCYSVGKVVHGRGWVGYR